MCVYYWQRQIQIVDFGRSLKVVRKECVQGQSVVSFGMFYVQLYGE